MKTLPAILAAALLAGASAPALAQPPHCPPGHAKKGWCQGGEHPVFGRGDRLPRDRYVVIRDYDRNGWPRPRDDEMYVRVDDDVYRIAVATGLILDVLR